MIKIEVPEKEFFNEATQEFYNIKGCTLQLEHSLISISKWESKWHKPFVTGKYDEPKTSEEILDYIRCMTLNSNIPPEVYYCLTEADVKAICDYINDPMTASTVSNIGGSHGRGEVVTSELVYYWMVAYQIPFECEKWHFNRLLMLIRICNAKNRDPKKMSNREIYKRNSALNAARRAKLHSKG